MSEPSISTNRASAKVEVLRDIIRSMQSPEDAESAAARLRIALDLYGLGESMMRQNLRRSFPTASDSEIETRIVAWLAERPGAEHGDAPGTPRALPK